MTRTHDDIELDLAFAVNGTLSEVEQAEIDAWLERDALLAAEHDALSAIRARMQAEDIRSPGEFGLARLLRDVSREVPVAAPVAPTAPRRAWVWQLAAAVAVLAFAAQTLFLRAPNGSPGDAGGYHLASAAPASGSADLIVTFAPGATEAQIRDLLVGLDVIIVDGPSALGFYGLDVLNNSTRAAAADGLRAAAGVIESVEDAPN